MDTLNGFSIDIRYAGFRTNGRAPISHKVARRSEPEAPAAVGPAPLYDESLSNRLKHWSYGCLFVLVWMLFENPGALLEKPGTGFFGVMLFGGIFGAMSFWFEPSWRLLREIARWRRSASATS